MEKQTESHINLFIEKRIEEEMFKNKNQLSFKSQEFTDKIHVLLNSYLKEINDNFKDSFKIINDEILEKIYPLYSLSEQNNTLENKLHELKNDLINKNTEIIELETEKKNWNKVSYTKFLDKQLLERNTDIEILKIKLSNSTKQNLALKDKILEEKNNQLQDLCSTGDIDLNLNDEIPLSDYNTDMSIIDNMNDKKSENNIAMNIKDKNNDSESDDCIKKNMNNHEVENTEILEEMEDTLKENQFEEAKKTEEENVSNNLKKYELYEYKNKKGEIKKYLKKKEGKKVCLFKYTENEEEIGDSIGEIRMLNNIEKASFYRKKTS